MQRPFPSPATSIAALALLATLLGACSSQPSKYKRRKGCDCPKWNLIEQPTDRGIHAILGHGTPADGLTATLVSASPVPPRS